MTRYEMKKDMIAKIASQLKSFGYDVYISENGEYGFYTNGSRVVSFESGYFDSVKFSGNYNSKHSGTGWRFDDGDGWVDIDQTTAEIFINANAPRWATTEQVTYTTLEQHLKKYGSSSRYVKI